MHGVSGASIFYLAVLVYYLRLNCLIAILQLPFTLVLLGLAEAVATLPFPNSFYIFLTTFVGGWSIQLLGCRSSMHHYFCSSADVELELEKATFSPWILTLSPGKASM
jgi:hypothetical protein